MNPESQDGEIESLNHLKTKFHILTIFNSPAIQSASVYVPFEIPTHLHPPQKILFTTINDNMNNPWYS